MLSLSIEMQTLIRRLFFFKILYFIISVDSMSFIIKDKVIYIMICISICLWICDGAMNYVGELRNVGTFIDSNYFE